MNIKEKIRNAADYMAMLEGTVDAKDLRNDAANIYADSYEDYLAIWDALGDNV